MISVVIRTKNSEGTLPSVISRLGLRDGDELIVVDSGSNDSTIRIARSAGAQVLRPDQDFHYSKALNTGFSAARNEWVLSLSSHSIPLVPNLLREYERALSDRVENLVAVYGGVYLSKRKAGREEPEVITSDTCKQNGLAPGGNVNALYRRISWQQHPFSEALPTGEDLEWFRWSMASMHTVLRYPAAAVLYRNQGTIKYMFNKGFNEVRVAVGLTGNPKISLLQLGIGLASLAKGVSLGDYSLPFALRQSAYRVGAFVGSRQSPRSNLTAAEPSIVSKA